MSVHSIFTLIRSGVRVGGLYSAFSPFHFLSSTQVPHCVQLESGSHQVDTFLSVYFFSIAETHSVRSN